MRKKTWLPVFPGFYGTIISPDSVIDDIIESLDDYDYNDMTFDTKKWADDISKDFCQLVATELSSILECNIRILFERVVSPKFYNFSTDCVDIEIQFLKCAVDTYLINNINEFNIYIHKKHTSYDGFISFHSNDYREWLPTYHDDMYKLGSVLEFILTNENNTISHDLQIQVLEQIDYFQYI